MRRFGLWGALTLLVIANAIALGRVAANRAGAPDSRIKLTERELPIAYSGDENTGISLSLTYGCDKGWLDKNKLAKLGFNCRVAEDDPKAEIYYRNVLPRKTYVVFEYQGEAWGKWLKNKIDLEKKNSKDITQRDIERQIKAQSRLFAIDVGNDPKELRTRYPDRSRYIITPAVINLGFGVQWNERLKSYSGPKKIYGYISDVLTSQIHVPLVFCKVLSPLRNQLRGAEPRYAVTLKYGENYEPWIVSVHLLNK